MPFMNVAAPIATPTTAPARAASEYPAGSAGGRSTPRARSTHDRPAARPAVITIPTPTDHRPNRKWKSPPSSATPATTATVTSGAVAHAVIPRNPPRYVATKPGAKNNPTHASTSGTALIQLTSSQPIPTGVRHRSLLTARQSLAPDEICHGAATGRPG